MSEPGGVYVVVAAEVRPWLKCRHCGRLLCEVDVRDGRTVVVIGEAYALESVIVCPGCGEVRKFKSVSV